MYFFFFYTLANACNTCHFYYGLHNEYGVLSHLWFDLHFFDDWWCWAWFYLLFGLLNIFMDIVFKSFSHCLNWWYDFWLFCLKVLCKSRIARHTECSIFLNSVIAYLLSCIVFSSTLFILMKSGVPPLPVMLVSHPRNSFLIQGLQGSRLCFLLCFL